MRDVVFENGYEAQAWREIQQWEQRPDLRVTKALRMAGRPVGFLTDKLLLQPVLERGADRLGNGMRAAATSVGARVDTGEVLRRTSGRVGRPVRDLAELRGVDLRTLDGLAHGLDRKYIAAGATWAELSRNASVRALQAVFDKLGVRLTKRKLAQAIPFLGAAAGGTLGAALADNTCQSAYMQYRRRYLLDKYPELRDG